MKTGVRLANYKWHITIGAIFILLYPPVFGQTTGKKCRSIVANGKASMLDSLSVLSSSIHIVTTGTPPPFVYDLATGTIAINSTECDSLLVCFQTIPVSFHSAIFKRSLLEYDSNAVFKERPLPKIQNQELFRTDDIEKSGSIVRAISAGNNQDVVVNSTMDIALHGKLSDQLSIRAQITDQNIPYQPEGTSRYVQDIDHIFIQLYNDNLALTAGDITLKNDHEGFLKYNKRVQGGHFENSFQIQGDVNASVSVAASVAKGKFASTKLDVSEGISGPYKIRANTGEKFLFIVANTEKVFLDGRLLQRGYDNDYIIDYNQSEITFTARVIITRYSRVSIDFEFADKNYSRSIIAANHTQESSRHSFFVNFYREKDNKNQPLLQNLSDDERQVLSEAGDSRMVYSKAFESVDFNENEILYKMMQINGHDVFQHSVHPDSALYRVRFMDVGPGMGNYVRQRLAGNGWIYQWVEPQNSIPQGSFEPITQLVAPTQEQMATAGGGFKFNGHEEAFAEMAFSNHDKNLYSPFDADDNYGTAYKFGLRSTNRQIGNYNLRSIIQMESLGKYFNVIDRYRSVEYDRYWKIHNMPDETSKDITFSASTILKNEAGNYFRYEGIKREFGSNYNGDQHTLGLAQHLGRLSLDGDYFYALSKNALYQSRWDRMQVNANYATSIVVPGYTYRNEKNIVDTSSDGFVIGSSEYFHEHVFHIKSQDTLKTVIGVNYAIRSDFAPEDGEFYQNHRGQTLSVQAKMPSHLNHSVNGVLSHRKTDHLRAVVNEGKGENISGAVHYAGRFWENVLSQEISYGISSGHEPRREYIFIQVPTGQGHYTWIDDNNDGIQDLSEFYEARFEDEKNYAKIFVPTDQYIAAFSTDLNLRVRYEPPVTWRNSTTILKSFARISGNSSFIYNTKTVDDNLWARLSPFIDVDALSFRNSQRIQLLYNRSYPFGMEYSFLQSKRRQVLTSGFEEVSREIARFTIRMSIWDGTVFRINMESGQSTSGSDYLSNRNFLIKHKELMPELEWLPSRQFRITGKLGWRGKNGEEQERNGKAVFRSAELGLNGNAAGGRMVGLNMAFTRINYDKPTNSFLEYEMLEAMRPGNNFTWRFRMQQDLVQGLRFSVNYDGRKSESGRAIHFGRVQLMAFF